MKKKITRQEAVIEALELLLGQVKENEFGNGNNFDRDAFEGEFDDSVLMMAYIYGDENE